MSSASSALMIAVHVQKLRVTFGDVVVLDDIDLRVAPGELFLLLGPSGCGKTTLLRSIAGFVTPDAGAIYIGERDVTTTPPHARRTGMVFQSFALWPHMTVAQNVAFGLQERRVPKAEITERVAHALGSVHMEHRAMSQIGELSGGEQQRVALARALVVRPACLLLDEPLSNLDAHLRHSMREEIRRVCKESGLTAVYVTHDQKEALAIADRVAIMQKGRILQTGTPAEIYRQPRSRVVAEFVGETNLLEGTISHASDDEVHLATSLGELVSRAALPGKARVGDKVWVSVRPECWTVRRGDAPVSQSASINRIAATVERTTYLGDLAELSLRCGEQRLRASELNPPSEGDTRASNIWLSVAPRDVVLLPFDDEHA